MKNLKIIIKEHFPKVVKIFHVCQELFHKKSNIKLIEKNMEFLRSTYNSHIGETCFIIGNGPSLRVEDLDKLKKSFCFASNKIFNLFNETSWRPTYYCISDINVMYDILNKFNIDKISNNVFLGIHYRYKYPVVNGANYVRLIYEDFYPGFPNFSDDATIGIYEGFTVTYMALQLAIYMGFKTIYLLGIDHNYSFSLNPDGTVIQNSNIKDHFSGENELTSKNAPALYKTTIAYQAAKKYADKHDIKIYNATRGGKLEVFERVDFDSLFPEDDKK